MNSMMMMNKIMMMLMMMMLIILLILIIILIMSILFVSHDQNNHPVTHLRVRVKKKGSKQNHRQPKINHTNIPPAFIQCQLGKEAQGISHKAKQGKTRQNTSRKCQVRYEIIAFYEYANLHIYLYIYIYSHTSCSKTNEKFSCGILYRIWPLNKTRIPQKHIIVI